MLFSFNICLYPPALACASLGFVVTCSLLYLLLFNKKKDLHWVSFVAGNHTLFNPPLNVLSFISQAHYLDKVVKGMTFLVPYVFFSFYPVLEKKMFMSPQLHTRLHQHVAVFAQMIGSSTLFHHLFVSKPASIDVKNTPPTLHHHKPRPLVTTVYNYFHLTLHTNKPFLPMSSFKGTGYDCTAPDPFTVFHAMLFCAACIMYSDTCKRNGSC